MQPEFLSTFQFFHLKIGFPAEVSHLIQRICADISVSDQVCQGHLRMVHEPEDRSGAVYSGASQNIRILPVCLCFFPDKIFLKGFICRPLRTADQELYIIIMLIPFLFPSDRCCYPLRSEKHPAYPAHPDCTASENRSHEHL